MAEPPAPEKPTVRATEVAVTLVARSATPTLPSASESEASNEATSEPHLVDPAPVSFQTTAAAERYRRKKLHPC